MSYLSGKHLHRRTFLRGMGATVALPFLDAMVPAGLSRTARAAQAATHTRLVCIEEVHGLAGCNGIGADKFLYAPEQVGRNYSLVPDNPLSTLDTFRDYTTIISNTDVFSAGDRWRPLQVQRGVPDAVSPQTDAGVGHLGGDIA
jgi:hypothetical protein